MSACTDVAVIIPAKNEEARIAATVAAATSAGDLVVVVDEASHDKTAHLAREAGARVVSRSRSTGKAAAMMAGAGRSLHMRHGTLRRVPGICCFLTPTLSTPPAKHGSLWLPCVREART